MLHFRLGGCQRQYLSTERFIDGIPCIFLLYIIFISCTTRIVWSSENAHDQMITTINRGPFTLSEYLSSSLHLGFITEKFFCCRATHETGLFDCSASPVKALYGWTKVWIRRERYNDVQLHYLPDHPTLFMIRLRSTRFYDVRMLSMRATTSLTSRVQATRQSSVLSPPVISQLSPVIRFVIHCSAFRHE